MNPEMNGRWQAGESPFDGIRLLLSGPDSHAHSTIASVARSLYFG
jgi:hypothetical protein